MNSTVLFTIQKQQPYCFLYSQKQHTCVPYYFLVFSDLESQDWHLAMAMQFQEGDECQVMDSCCLPPQIIPLIYLLGMD